MKYWSLFVRSSMSRISPSPLTRVWCRRFFRVRPGLDEEGLAQRAVHRREDARDGGLGEEERIPLEARLPVFAAREARGGGVRVQAADGGAQGALFVDRGRSDVGHRREVLDQVNDLPLSVERGLDVRAVDHEIVDALVGADVNEAGRGVGLAARGLGGHAPAGVVSARGEGLRDDGAGSGARRQRQRAAVIGAVDMRGLALPRGERQDDGKQKQDGKEKTAISIQRMSLREGFLNVDESLDMCLDTRAGGFN